MACRIDPLGWGLVFTDDGLLKSELRKKSKQLNKLRIEVNEISRIVSSKLLSTQFYILKKALQHNVNLYKDKVIQTHERKLRNLTGNSTLPFDASDTVTNLSSITLTKDQLNILKYGLNCSITPQKINKANVYTCFETVNYNIHNHLTDQGKASEIKRHLSGIAHAYCNSFKPSTKDLHKIKTIKELRKNRNIVITKPDKGNGVVILDRTTNDKGLFEIINDETNFRSIENDPTIKREGSLTILLRKLRKSNEITDEDYKNIYPKGSSPARIYGLPKMHKKRKEDGSPPIVSIGTHNYNIAKYLSELIKPCIPTEFSTKDTFSFVKEVRNLNMKNKCMVSFDVESLFTNIPLKKTIELAVNTIICHSQELKTSNENLTKLLLLATTGTHFLFKGKYFEQIDGVSMGLH
ncbi:uncharacterized protein LOC117107595 [Anneissia japonica]|uniref:uncharacterized protein LOC117107595 n=1 Tax=Anneissia japonica TaxID=1529436 RepID=UPI001425A771|nr:uncharacterized protein LOC117107595 [Anneissia japonica]